MKAIFPLLEPDLTRLKPTPDPLPEPWDFTPLETPVRLDQHSWPEGTRPWVSIVVAAFQHAAFIGDALDGFLMQEVTFPVEIIVHDDASSDGTVEILEQYRSRYPHLFRLILQKENIYSRNRRCFPLLYEASLGYYLACCDGDDYWTHPLKLETQSRVMQAYPQASQCGHNTYADVASPSGKIGRVVLDHPLSALSSTTGLYYASRKETFILGAIPPTLSILSRKHPLPHSDAYHSLVIEDRYNFSHIAVHGGVIYLHAPMSFYRFHAGGVFSSVGREKQCREIVCSYRTFLKEIPAHWAAASSVFLVNLGIEQMHIGYSTRNTAALREGVRTYLTAVRYSLQGFGALKLSTLPVVLESVARVLSKPLLFAAVVIRNRLTSSARRC
jgi:glycosyltransferase involved in cell wall biosynthesis